MVHPTSSYRISHHEISREEALENIQKGKSITIVASAILAALGITLAAAVSPIPGILLLVITAYFGYNSFQVLNNVESAIKNPIEYHLKDGLGTFFKRAFLQDELTTQKEHAHNLLTENTFCFGFFAKLIVEAIYPERR